MTRKDYQALAEAVRKVRNAMRADAHLSNFAQRAINELLIRELTSTLRVNNPAFDEQRFMAAYDA